MYMSTNTIVEAPMRSGEFRSAVRGVQIGFEFELCIPHGEVNQTQVVPPPRTWLKNKTVLDLLDGFTTRKSDYTWIDTLDNTIVIKSGKKSQFQGNKNVTRVYREWVSTEIERVANLDPEYFLNAIKSSLNEILRYSRDAFNQEELFRFDLEERSAKRARLASDAAESFARWVDAVKSEVGLDFSNPDAVTAEQYTSVVTARKFAVLQDISRKEWLNTAYPIDAPWNKLRSINETALLRLREPYFENTRIGKNHFVDFCKEVFGSDDLVTLFKTVWNLNTNAREGRPAAYMKELLYYFLVPTARAPAQPVDPSSIYDNNYQVIAAEWLKKELEPVLGTIEIFTRYHQARKKLDRWYIEPDGSLRPKLPDYSLEFVGPPKSAKESLSDLQKFADAAQRLKLYTNESTGIHINVSIPRRLDLLKLAMFSADKRALDTFGRLNTSHGRRYAANVIDKLTSKYKVNDIGKPGTLDRLRDLALTITSDHFSSISATGGETGYISFRHAGGDYLSKMPDLIRTIKTFIRAMVIASSPDAMRQEYINKLEKAVSKTDILYYDPNDPKNAKQPTVFVDKPQSGYRAFVKSDKKDTRMKSVTAYKESGIRIIVFYLAVLGQFTGDPNDLVDSIRGDSRFDDLGDLSITSDPRARSLMQVQMGNLSPSTRQIIDSAPDNHFYRVVAEPVNTDQEAQMQLISNNTVGLYPAGQRGALADRIAVALVAPEVIMPGNENFGRMYNRLYRSAMMGTTRPRLPESIDVSLRRHTVAPFSGIMNGILGRPI